MMKFLSVVFSTFLFMSFAQAEVYCCDKSSGQAMSVAGHASYSSCKGDNNVAFGSRCQALGGQCSSSCKGRGQGNDRKRCPKGGEFLFSINSGSDSKRCYAQEGASIQGGEKRGACCKNKRGSRRRR